MLGFIVLILMSLAILSGGLLALFAGRRWYAVWLGFATYFFITRVLDLALIRTSEIVRNWGGLVIALLVVALVVFLRDRVIKFVPPIGGFIVSAMIAERLLGFIHPEAGKYLFFAVLLAGGLMGLYLFSRRLDFDDAVIVLSALWGASYISKVIFDFVDVFLISAVSVLGNSGPNRADRRTSADQSPGVDHGCCGGCSADRLSAGSHRWLQQQAFKIDPHLAHQPGTLPGLRSGSAWRCPLGVDHRLAQTTARAAG
jgi:hypothetical protein